MTWQHPFRKSTITDRFGDNEPPRTSPHRGTDYAPGARELIPAVTSGVVTQIEYSNCLGWFVEYKTDEHGLFVGNAHLYCNKHDSIDCDGRGHEDGSTCMKNLKVGDKVEAGQPVGRVGNSGRCSRGAHLHITISKKPDMRWAKPFDIEKFIDQKIKKQEKEEARELRKQKKQRPEKIDATESTQTVEECEPKVTAPEKGQSLPQSILEAVRTILLWLKG